MNTGMLWFDNNPKTALVQKVQEAADYFQKKYGKTPDLCLVNPAMLAESQMQAGAIIVRPWKTVTPGHLWIGVEEKQ